MIIRQNKQSFAQSIKGRVDVDLKYKDPKNLKTRIAWNRTNPRKTNYNAQSFKMLSFQHSCT